ncbi:hypothetical protein MPL3365_40008 [Mesorhizobium plurifarium]|uniref:Uncharacterized protein n=1 Tax=Mesorhizobium plurifarium TaxID=69974 RepID=A0A090GFU5_MESPL|nr:hypothetical protein MPL3365_40008 [Mesorhizobium plurifarium]
MPHEFAGETALRPPRDPTQFPKPNPFKLLQEFNGSRNCAGKSTCLCSGQIPAQAAALTPTLGAGAGKGAGASWVQFDG